MPSRPGSSPPRCPQELTKWPLAIHSHLHAGLCHRFKLTPTYELRAPQSAPALPTRLSLPFFISEEISQVRGRRFANEHGRDSDEFVESLW